MKVADHPLEARDQIEAGSFARDCVWGERIGLPPKKRRLWLASRALARRDLLWLCREGLGLTRLTEDIHRAPADFCQSIVTTPNGFGNLRDPRGNGKTSLATRGLPIWVVIQDPIECAQRGWPILGRESRIGVSTLKETFTQFIMRVLDADLKSDVLRFLFPELLPEVPKRWNLKEMELRRGLPPDLAQHPLFADYPSMTRFPDPTFAARSLEGGAAGAHTQLELIDDAVNEKTWNSAVNIETAIHGIRQSFNVTRTEAGARLVTGNSWAPDDVVNTIDREDGNWRVFLRSLTACAGCKDGYPVDARGVVEVGPDGRLSHQHEGETFTWLMKDALGQIPDPAHLRQQCGSLHIYMAQYENNPMAVGATLWSYDRLPRYSITVKEKPLLAHTDVVRYAALDDPEKEDWTRIKDLDVAITYDPAHGSLTGDRSDRTSRHGIVVGARTGFDTMLILEAWAARMDDGVGAIERLVDMIIRFRPRRVGIDATGYQNIIRPLLQRELLRRKVGWLSLDTGIVPIRRTKDQGSKIEIIRESVGYMINSRVLQVSPAAAGFAELGMEIEGFDISPLRDLLDCLWMLTQLWEVGIPLTGERMRAMRYKAFQNRRQMKRKGGVTGYGNM